MSVFGQLPHTKKTDNRKLIKCNNYGQQFSSSQELSTQHNSVVTTTTSKTKTPTAHVTKLPIPFNSFALQYYKQAPMKILYLYSVIFYSGYLLPYKLQSTKGGYVTTSLSVIWLTEYLASR